MLTLLTKLPRATYWITDVVAVDRGSCDQSWLPRSSKCLDPDEAERELMPGRVCRPELFMFERNVKFLYYRTAVKFLRGAYFHRYTCNAILRPPGHILF